MDVGPDRTESEDAIKHLDGLYVGQLRPDELRAFNTACDQGIALRSYGGAGGLLGLAKVRIRRGPLGLD